MKTVALIDHHENGHHLAFIRLFAKYLLKLNYKLLICFPGKEQEIKSFLLEHESDLSNVKFCKINLIKKKFSNVGRFNNAVSTLHFWWKTRLILKKAERDLHVRIDVVFFSWLDDYLANDLPHQAVDMIFPFRWSGLYFHPWYLHKENVNNRVSVTSIDSVLQSQKCISVAIHDEFLQEKLQSRILKRIVFFPENADSTAPEKTYSLAIEIKSKARQRTVVSLIGISKRKGFLFLMKLIMSIDIDKYFFFFSGDISNHDFDQIEALSVKTFLDNLPENCLYYPHSIEEGGKINAVIDVSDILYIVYNNFKSSSNFNTKAAIFKKPVLATNKFWIGRVTEKYRMGKTVTEGSTEEMISALNELHDQLSKKTFDYSYYPDYLLLHHEKNLEYAFKLALTC